MKILYFVLVFPVFFWGVFSFLDCINGENIIFCSGLSKLIGFFLFWTGLMVKILYFVLVFPVFFWGFFLFWTALMVKILFFVRGFFLEFFPFLDWINCENNIFRIGFFFG